MNWAHLPVAGGLYDQHPRLLEEWAIIWSMKSQHEKRKKAMDEAQAQRKSKTNTKRR